MDFNRDGALDLIYAVSTGCDGTLLRDRDRDGGGGGSRSGGGEDELQGDGHAPCAVSEIHVALNGRADSEQHAAGMLTYAYVC
jgi:hypothetical protein